MEERGRGVRAARRGYGARASIVNRAHFIAARLAVLAVGLVLAVTAPAQAQEVTKRVLALGDSLTAGFGLSANNSFPARLQTWLRKAGLNVSIINAGVSGDTSAGGLARLDWVLASAAPDFAIVELGANDALRGLSTRALYDNLDKIVARLQTRHVKVLLAGMYAPRNLGRDYAAEFDAVYPRLAKAHGVALYPFFLDGVAENPALLQADGLHPNAQGVDVIVDRIGPHVLRLIKGP